MTQEWINILLLSFVGFLLFNEKRYKRLVWLKAFALLLPVIYALQLSLPSFFPGEFVRLETFNLFAARRSLMYLLILAAIWEVFHRDFGKKLKWFWWSFGVIVLTGVFTQIQIHEFVGVGTGLIGGDIGYHLQRNLPYFLPRIALYVPLVFLIREAFKKNHFVLISFSALAAGELVSDSLKLISNYEIIYLMQIRLDLFWLTLFSCMMLYSILRVPVFAFVNKTRASINNTEVNNYLIVDSLGGTSTAESKGRVGNIRNVLQMDSRDLGKYSEEIDEAEEAINSLVHESRFSNQHLLNSAELRKYLEFHGVSHAEGFVLIHNIERHVMKDIPGGNFVRKDDIDKALNIYFDK